MQLQLDIETSTESSVSKLSSDYWRLEKIWQENRDYVTLKILALQQL